MGKKIMGKNPHPAMPDGGRMTETTDVVVDGGDCPVVTTINTYNIHINIDLCGAKDCPLRVEPEGE